MLAGLTLIGSVNVARFLTGSRAKFAVQLKSFFSKILDFVSGTRKKGFSAVALGETL